MRVCVTTGTPDEGLLLTSYEPRRDRTPDGWRFVRELARHASSRQFESQPTEARGRYEPQLNAHRSIHQADMARPRCESSWVQWRPGEVVVHQEVWKDRVWSARPFTVVEDDGERLLLWMPRGTRRKVPMTPPSRPDPATLDDRIIELLARRDWVYVDHSWDVDTLWIVRAGDWHSIWVSWLPTGEHYGWYVNLQEPLRRTPIGFSAMDLMLDVVVEPDLCWRWKDDEQFRRIIDLGIFDQGTGAQVRSEALRVIEWIERRAAPFDEPWPDWQPDSAWRQPVLSPRWDTTCR